MMKKLLVGLLALGSISSFAKCSINFDDTKASRLPSKVRTILASKGYDVIMNRRKLDGADFSVMVQEKVFTDGEMFVVIRLSHTSGFRKRYDTMSSNGRDHIVVDEFNADLEYRASLASSVAERNELLSRINPDLNRLVTKSDPLVIAANLIGSCSELLGR